MPEPIKDLLTTTEVCNLLRVSDETVKTYILSGKLEGFKLPGGHFRIYADSVTAFMRPSRYEDGTTDLHPSRYEDD